MASSAEHFEQCERFLRFRLRETAGESERGSAACGPSLTLSREAGARAVSISEALTSRLNAEAPEDSAPWALFDQNLVTRIIEEHHLPPETEAHLPEDRVPLTNDIVSELLGRHPNDWTLFHHTASTILRLCRLGHAVVVGRGGNWITQRLPNTLHVRLIGSLPRRIDHIRRKFGMSEEAAAKYLNETDAARSRYVKSHLQQDIADPHGYHLVVNTDDLDDAAVVDLLAHALRTRMTKGSLGLPDQ